MVLVIARVVVDVTIHVVLLILLQEVGEVQELSVVLRNVSLDFLS